MKRQHVQRNTARTAPRLAYSLVEAANLIGIGTTTLNELITSGDLPTLTIGRRRLVASEDLETFVRQRRRAASSRV